MTERFSNPVPQLLDNDGNPVVEGTLDFFETGTSTPKATFADVAQNTQNANPVALDGSGRTPNIFYAGTARVVLKTKAGVQIWDRDVVGLLGTGEGFDTWSSVVEYEKEAYVVGSDDLIYRSLQNNNLGNDPTISPSFWVNVEFISAWNPNVTYSIGDIVKATDGLLYSSRVDSNLNNDPQSGLSPTEWGPASFTTFIEDFDTPANYTGSAGKFLRANSVPDALEFADLSLPRSISIKNTDSPFAATTGQTIAADVTSGTISVTWNVTSAAVGDTIKLASMRGDVGANALTVTLTGGNFKVNDDQEPPVEQTDTILSISTNNIETIMTVLSIGPVIVGVAL